MRIIILPLIFSFFFSFVAFSQTQTNPVNMMSGQSMSQTPKTPAQAQQTIKNAEKPKEQEFKMPIKPKVEAQGEITYLSPGIIAYQGSQWVGSDNLLNVGKDIAIYVEIVKSPTQQIPFDEESIKIKLSDIFTKNGIGTLPTGFTDKPPLPFMHALVMIVPFEKGFLAYCSVRLFEQVTLPRVILADQTFFQAITWEKQNLVVAAPQDITREVTNTLVEMTNNFVERVKYFQTLDRTR